MKKIKTDKAQDGLDIVLIGAWCLFFAIAGLSKGCALIPF